MISTVYPQNAIDFANKWKQVDNEGGNLARAHIAIVTQHNNLLKALQQSEIALIYAISNSPEIYVNKALTLELNKIRAALEKVQS